MEYRDGRGKAPACGDSSRRRDRDGVQRRMWRDPHALCYRGGDCEAACERSGFGGITLSGGTMQSAFIDSLSTHGYAWRFRQIHEHECWCVPPWCVELGGRVDIPIQPVGCSGFELSGTHVDVLIQLDNFFYFSLFFLFLLMTSQECSLVFLEAERSVCHRSRTGRS